eukprot:765448-Hanusia_phi.AAC.6
MRSKDTGRTCRASRERKRRDHRGRQAVKGPRRVGTKGRDDGCGLGGGRARENEHQGGGES